MLTYWPPCVHAVYAHKRKYIFTHPHTLIHMFSYTYIHVHRNPHSVPKSLVFMFFMTISVQFHYYFHQINLYYLENSMRPCLSVCLSFFPF